MHPPFPELSINCKADYDFNSTNKQGFTLIPLVLSVKALTSLWTWLISILFYCVIVLPHSGPRAFLYK